MASNAVKVILLTVVLAIPLVYLFAEEEYGLQQKLAEIEKSPGYAPAVFEQTKTSQVKKTTKYQVLYGYEVQGRAYHVATMWTDQQGLLRYISDPDPKIAYSKNDPSIAVDMHYFMVPHPAASGMVLLGLFIALVISLKISWLLGWLRRSKPAIIRRAS